MAGKATTIKLNVVYETTAAAQQIANLDAKLDALIKRKGLVNTAANKTSATLRNAGKEAGQGTIQFRNMALAGAQLAQGLASGNVSASTLTGSLSRLGGKLGTIGIILAVGAAALALFKRNSDRASEASLKFEKQLRDTRRRVDDLLRVDRKSPFQGEIDNITDSIRDLDRELDKQRKGLFARLFGNLSLPNVGRFLFGGEDPQTRRQRNQLSGQAGRLTSEGEQSMLVDQATRRFALQNTSAELLSNTSMDRLQGELDALREHFTSLIEAGLDPASDRAQNLQLSLQIGEKRLRDMTRAADVMNAGLNTMASAIEDFVVTGTFQFEKFLDDILRLMITTTTTDVIDNIMRGAFKTGTTTSGGPTVTSHAHGGFIPGPTNQPRLALVHGGEEVIPVGARRGGDTLVTHVNFTVTAIDAQDVGRFFETNKGLIAKHIVDAADRSRGMRRRLSR